MRGIRSVWGRNAICPTVIPSVRQDSAGADDASSSSPTSSSSSSSSNVLSRALERLVIKFPKVFESPESHRLQVLLTACEHERGVVGRYGFRCDEEYFYPASTVKLCVAAAALSTVRRFMQKHGGVFQDEYRITSPLIFHYCVDGGEGAGRVIEEKVLLVDDTNRDGHTITLAHLIRNIFLVSSNGAFNLLLDFVGRATLDSFLRSFMGFKHFRIRDYFQDDKFGPTNGMKLLGVEVVLDSITIGLKCGNAFASLYDEVGQHDSDPSPLFDNYLVGKGYVSSEDDWDAAGQHSRAWEEKEETHGVQQTKAKDSGSSDENASEAIDEKKTLFHSSKCFARKHQASLVELQDFLIHVVGGFFQPEGNVQHVLTQADRLFLMETMAMKTTDSSNPCYSERIDYFPEWNKFFLPGIRNLRSEKAFRIYNKLGQAYGFSLDNAYVLDLETGKSFFLTACLYTNKNEILNDDCYEYDRTGEPFLSQLAEAVGMELGFVDRDLKMVDVAVAGNLSIQMKIKS